MHLAMTDKWECFDDSAELFAKPKRAFPGNACPLIAIKIPDQICIGQSFGITKTMSLKFTPFFKSRKSISRFL
jgi:hypothetical protein